MSTPLETLKSRISARTGTDIAKGEVWLGRELFGGSRTPDSHLKLADRLNHALVCLSITDDQSVKPDLGYTYFSPADLERAARLWDGPVLGVIDGPLQEMVNTLGLVEVLTLWIQDPQAIESHYRSFAQKARALADRIADMPIDGVVFTDDLAMDAGPLINPDDIDALCTPFYSTLVPELKKKQKAVLFHSCGNLSALIPLIRSWQPDGLAAIQSRINDFDALFKGFDADIFILGGIEVEDLQSRGMDPEILCSLERQLRGPSNLILGTSCGLFQADFLDRLQAIYQRLTS